MSKFTDHLLALAHLCLNKEDETSEETLKEELGIYAAETGMDRELGFDSEDLLNELLLEVQKA